MISALCSLGISTINLLLMVTKWKRTDHRCLVNTVAEESLRNLISKVLQVEQGMFTTILEQGKARMKDMYICPRYQTAGMAPSWP
jgi:hypothetical protein